MFIELSRLVTGPVPSTTNSKTLRVRSWIVVLYLRWPGIIIVFNLFRKNASWTKSVRIKRQYCFFFFFFIFGKILCRCDKNISINRTSNTDTTELNLNSHRLLEEIFAFYYSRRVSLIEIHYLVSIEMKRPYERPGKSRTRGSTTIYDERDWTSKNEGRLFATGVHGISASINTEPIQAGSTWWDRKDVQTVCGNPRLDLHPYIDFAPSVDRFCLLWKHPLLLVRS